MRERYLRSDIPCGYEACFECSSFPGYKAVLPVEGARGHAKFNGKAGHWLVIDTNIVLHQVSTRPGTYSLDVSLIIRVVPQIDVLESLPAEIPIILPSTTLAETRHRSLPLFNRLQSLLADEDRKVWIFWNEERRETATKVERYRTGGDEAVGRIDEDDTGNGMDVIEAEDKDGKIVRETVNDRNDRGE